MVVDEDEFTKKKKQRMEEIAELEEKRQLEEFKKAKRQHMKRMRTEQDDTLPECWKLHTQCKRLKRMPPEEEEILDMTGWWNMAEGMCLMAGNLRMRLEKDTARVLRRMEGMGIDRILSDSQDWWKRARAWVGVENPPQSPKTITARVSCQDQDIIQLEEVTGETSDPSIQEEDHSSQDDREVPHPSFRKSKL